MTLASGRWLRRFPKPVPSPSFGIGETVYVIPYGDQKYDNAPLTVIRVSARRYVTRHAATDEDVAVDFEGVSAAPTE